MVNAWVFPDERTEFKVYVGFCFYEHLLSQSMATQQIPTQPAGTIQESTGALWGKLLQNGLYLASSCTPTKPVSLGFTES